MIANLTVVVNAIVRNISIRKKLEPFLTSKQQGSYSTEKSLIAGEIETEA